MTLHPHTRLLVAILLQVSFSFGCDQSEAADSESPAQSQDNGQTGSVGQVECLEAADCRDRARSRLDALHAPVLNPRTFVSSACTQLASAGTRTSGPVCACDTDGGSVLVGFGECAVVGRAGGCLYPAEDFAGCTVGESDSCVATCGELERRIAEDAARTFTAQILHAECLDRRCQTVLQVEDRCFPQDGLSEGRSYDCGLGAEAILDAYAEDTARASQ